MKAFKSGNIKDHNIKDEDINNVFTVDFNGKYGDFKTYAIQGMKLLSSNQEVVEKTKEILEICDKDNVLDLKHKNFFTLGVAFKLEGFTLCLGSDQDAEIFQLYETEFNELTDIVSGILQNDYIRYSKSYGLN
jgi:hypothetical protein